MVDFANILFAGPCNARCPFCIGRQLDPALNTPNLDRFPPHNLDAFLALVRHHVVGQVVLTGTNTDPQCYRHEGRLLDHLRAQLPAATRLSLHTNGRLALRRPDTFNAYDRVSLSLPSFRSQTYRRMMGVAGVPDLAAILRLATVPVKVSCVVTDANRQELAEFLARCRTAGVQRVVLRKLYGETRSWSALAGLVRLELQPCGDYRNNPVFDYHGMEVTLWDFAHSRSTAINLFANGTISTEYLLAQVRPISGPWLIWDTSTHTILGISKDSDEGLDRCKVS